MSEDRESLPKVLGTPINYCRISDKNDCLNIVVNSINYSFVSTSM